MHLQQLQYFKMVAEIGHMTQAARLLHVSQPALSMSISNLEEELGAQLFEKKGRMLQLTQCGELFLRHAITAIGAIEDARGEIARLTSTANQTIHISSTYSLSSSLIPGIIEAFSQQNPGVVIHLQQGPNMELLQHVAGRETDFVFGRIPPDATGKELRYIPLYTEEMVALLHRDHALAGRASLDLEELRGERFIFFHESTGFNRIVMDLFRQVSYQPDIRYEVHDNSTCASLVSAGLGVALVGPAPLYESMPVRQIPLSSPRSSTQIYLVWNAETAKNAPPLYHHFLKHVNSVYTQEGTRGE